MDNPERRRFYQMLWETGGSQGDIAKLCSEDIDKQNQVISFKRAKTKKRSSKAPSIKYGTRVVSLLQELPAQGPLFPNLARVQSKDRANEFRQRCEGLKIKGVTLHSYRYAWAERARSCGYPERFAMIALGHASKAIHHAYAKNAAVEIPSIEEWKQSLHLG